MALHLIIKALNPAIENRPLKDKHGRPLGRIKRLPNGTFAGYDAKGKLKGFYNPKTDQTYDHKRTFVGTGNLLSALIVVPSDLFNSLVNLRKE